MVKKNSCPEVKSVTLKLEKLSVRSKFVKHCLGKKVKIRIFIRMASVAPRFGILFKN
jgi:hypothetical protein